MSAAPDTLEIVAAHVALLVDRPVEVGSVVGLRMNLSQGRGPGLVLVGRAGDFLARTAFNDSAKISGAVVAEVCPDS